MKIGAKSDIEQIYVPYYRRVVAVAGTSFFWSADSGASWTAHGTGLPATVSSLSLVCDSVLIGGGLYGVSRSTDGGINWERLTGGVLSSPIGDVLATDGGDLFIGGEEFNLGPGLPGFGVYRSSDCGTSWSACTSGLTNTTVRSLAIDSLGFLYAGTKGNSVLRSTEAVLRPLPSPLGVNVITTASAVVTGKTIPRGTASSWYVEYGTTPALGLATQGQSIGSGYIPLVTSATLVELLPGTRYYVRCAARNYNGALRSVQLDFTTICFPPEPLEPADGADSILQQRYVWRKTRGASNYRLLIAKDNSFADPQIILDTLVIDTACTVGNLDFEQWSYWKVSAINESGASEYSESRSIASRTGLPSPVVIVTPSKGSLIAAPTVSLRWTHAVFGERYVVQLTTDSLFAASSLRLDTTVVDTSFVVTKLEAMTKYRLRVRAQNHAGNSSWSNPCMFSTLGTNQVEQLTMDVPKECALAQNYPNPFNPTTIIGYRVSGEKSGSGVWGPGSRWVKLAVYDMLGREVAVLVDERKEPGSYEAKFDGSEFSSGVYLCRIHAGDFIETRKLLLVR